MLFPEIHIGLALQRNKMNMGMGNFKTEADFSHGKLAATTPIGKALLGHAKGDVVEANVPSGVLKFKILDISI